MTNPSTANTHGYGIHGVGFKKCPNCGEEVQRKLTQSKVAGRKYTRCYNCAPTVFHRVKELLTP